MIDILKSHYKSFSKFTVVGGINTVIDFSAFYLLFEVFGIGFVIAHIGAFSVAVINSFVFNAIWTFKNLKRGQLFKQVAMFLVIAVFGLGLSTLTIYLCAPYMNIYLAKIAAMAVSLVWNYVGSWLFVFRSPRD